MMDFSVPPETYQQWLTCFQHLQEHPTDYRVLELLAQGKYIGKPAEAFLVRLSDVVSLVLTASCRRFLRQLDEALQDGETDMAMLLALRLKKNIRKCFFYRALPFLERNYIETLDRGFEGQLDSFWKSFLGQLKKTVRDSMDPRMEDVLMEMKRIKIT